MPQEQLTKISLKIKITTQFTVIMVDENPKGREQRKSLASEMAEALGLPQFAKLFRMIRGDVKAAFLQAQQEEVIRAMHANRPLGIAKQETYSTGLAAIIDRHQEALRKHIPVGYRNMINLTAQFPQAGHQYVDLRITHQADGTLAAGIYIPDINRFEIAMSASGLEIYLLTPIPQILTIVEQQLQTALASE